MIAYSMRSALIPSLTILVAGCLLDLDRFQQAENVGGGGSTTGGSGGAATTVGSGGTGGAGGTNEVATWCTTDTTAFHDNFERQVSGGWGLPTPGSTLPKTYDLGVALQRFSVNGYEGEITITGMAPVRARLDFTELPSTFEANATIGFTNYGGNGESVAASIYLLSGMNQNRYEVRLVNNQKADIVELLLVEVDEGVGVPLVPAIDLDTNPTLGLNYHVRARITSGPVALKIAVWREDEPEPTEWTAVGSPSILPSGEEIALAIFAEGDPGGSHAALFDDFRVCTEPD